MKKLVVLIVMLLSITNVNAEEKIKVHMFRGDGCGVCHTAIDYFNNLEGKYDDEIELIFYESNYNEDHYNLLVDVLKEANMVYEGVPVIVVGDKVQIGFNELYGQEVIDNALAAKDDETYYDLVAKVIGDTEASVIPESLEEATDAEGISYWDSDEAKAESTNNMIVLIIFGIVILGIGGFIFIPSKK